MRRRCRWGCRSSDGLEAKRWCLRSPPACNKSTAFSVLDRMPPVFIIPLVAIGCGTAIILTAMNMIGKYFLDRRQPVSDESLGEILRRLERIEQIVDTTGIEVERL